jgi:predicted GTPase
MTRSPHIMQTPASPALADGVPEGSAASDPMGAAGLLRLAAIGEELGTQRVSHDARELASRVAEGRFFVACIGQFKRGKSTLINALLGEAILPVGFVPVTAVPTVIRHGERRLARIRARDLTWHEIAITDLHLFVSEEYNSENSKGVLGVEVFLPSPLLSTGMCLVDTPGLGSVFTGNSATTQAFIPHIDAALVVVGADPPLAGEELALVEAVARQARNLLLVLNKADRATDAERAAAVSFTRQQLEKRLRRPVGPIFEVSARERLETREPQRDWEKLLQALHELVDGSARGILYAAGKRGIARLSEELMLIIQAERDAHRRPLEESERRIAAMNITIADSERALRELGFLFLAEQQHLSDVFVARHRKFLHAVLPEARAEFAAALKANMRGPGPSCRRALMRAAQEIARRRVLPWLRVEQSDAETSFRLAAARFVRMGNDFLERLSDAGIPELARLPHALDSRPGFRYPSEFMFGDLIAIAQPASPVRWLADFVLGIAGARRVIANDAREFLDYLLEMNSCRVQSDILNRVQESRGQLETEIRKLLHEVSRIAGQALERARAARAAGAAATEAALARLDELETAVSQIRAAGGE